MPSFAKTNPSSSSTPPPDDVPPPIDLDDVTEETRRRIYDATVAFHFAVPPGTEEHMPFYTADEARLCVWHAFGRWFAAWYILEEVFNENLREEAKQVLVTIHTSEGSPYGIGFQDV